MTLVLQDLTSIKWIIYKVKKLLVNICHVILIEQQKILSYNYMYFKLTLRYLHQKCSHESESKDLKPLTESATGGWCGLW